MWTRDSKNKIMFEERMDKYDIFRNPEVKRLLFYHFLAFHFVSYLKNFGNKITYSFNISDMF